MAKQGLLFNLSEEAQQELKQRVSQHQSTRESKANPTAEVEAENPTADEELERRILGVSMRSSALEVEMASNAGEIVEAELKSATMIARRPATEAQRNPHMENLTALVAEDKGDQGARQSKATRIDQNPESCGPLCKG